MAPPPKTRTRGKKLPPGAGATAAAAKKAAAEAAALASAANAVEKTPHVLDPESDKDAVNMEVDQETVAAKAWIKEKVDQEVVRISCCCSSSSA